MAYTADQAAELPERVTLDKLPTPNPGRKPMQKYMILADWMREEPGTWFKVAETHSNQLASNFRAGNYVAFPRGEFEFQSRKDEATGQHTVWGRKPVEEE